MNHNSDVPQPHRHPIHSPETEWAQSLTAAICVLPSVQDQISERAYEIYLQAGLPEGAALEHWLCAENEAITWIHSAISCTTVAT